MVRPRLIVSDSRTSCVRDVNSFGIPAATASTTIAFQAFQYLSAHYGGTPVGDVLGDQLRRQAGPDGVFHSDKGVNKCIHAMGGSEYDAAAILVGLNETWKRRQDKSSAARQGLDNDEWRALTIPGAKDTCVAVSDRVSDLPYVQ